MVCRILSSIFGRDTRGTQCLNLFAALSWVVALALHHYNMVDIFLPAPVSASSTSIMVSSVLTIGFAVIGLYSSGPAHQSIKMFALLLGSITQLIIANRYYNSYPPLEMTLIASTVLAIWLFWAAYYILRCEGKDGLHHRKS